MATGVEIDFVVKDSLKALEIYESIFELEVTEKTNFKPGNNEVVFSIYGTNFHMLDENPEYGLNAPKEANGSIWFNVIVPDIEKTHDKAIKAGCSEIQGVTRMDEMGVSNSIFTDPFGYMWMVHQVHREVSFEEREEIFKKEFD